MLKLAIRLALILLLLTGCAGARPSSSDGSQHPSTDPPTGQVDSPSSVGQAASGKGAEAPASPPLPSRAPELIIWAVDLSGVQAPEILFRGDEPDTTLVGTSRDGRYFLLKKGLGLYKGDDRAIPYLLDRETGALTTGQEVNMRTGLWSGYGFWIDDLLHLNLDLTVTTYPALAEALGPSPERSIRSATVADPHGRFVALIGQPWSPDRFDLVWGDLDGTGLIRLANLVKPYETQIGNVAIVALSPDERYIAVAADEPYAMIIDTVNPDQEQWVTIKPPADRGNWNNLLWAPSSEHLLVGGLGVVNLAGELVLASQEGDAFWSKDGKALIIPATDRPWRLTTLDAQRKEFSAPNSWPVGFLPDGRLITSFFDPGG